MPDRLSVVRLKTALRFRPPGVDLARAGIFIHNGDEIWSSRLCRCSPTRSARCSMRRSADRCRGSRSRMPPPAARFCHGCCASISSDILSASALRAVRSRAMRTLPALTSAGRKAKPRP